MPRRSPLGQFVSKQKAADHGDLADKTVAELIAEYDRVAQRQAEHANSVLYCPHAPYPRQREFVDLDCRESLYGGATRGGKTDALLMAALKYVDRAGYSAIIFRKKLSDLRHSTEGLIPRLHQWLGGSAATWKEQDKTYQFPSGAMLQLGGLDNEAIDKYNFQGGAYQFIGFDEITHLRQRATYIYLLSRLSRLAGVDIPLRARATANPGGPGAHWVKEYFLEGQSKERIYVPSYIQDNPSVDEAAVRASLALLDETTRRQLENGEWIDDGGELIFAYDAIRNATTIPRDLTDYVLGVDYGYSADSAFVVMGYRQGDRNVYAIEAHKKPGMLVDEAADVVRSLNARYKFSRMVGDQGGLGKTYVEEARKRFLLPIQPAEKHDKQGYLRLMSAGLARGTIKVDPERCEPLLKEWRSARWNTDADDIATGCPDHCLDAALYAWRACTNYHEEAPTPKPTHEEAIAEEVKRYFPQAHDPFYRAREWWEPKDSR